MKKEIISEHHAKLYSGNLENGLTFARELLGVSSLEKESDVSLRLYDSCGIADARELKFLSYLAPVARSTHTIVIAAHDLTREAQNALLKIFEDPPERTRFILIVPSIRGLLPTLLSRLERVGAHDEEKTLPTLPENIKEEHEDVARIAKEGDRDRIEAYLEAYETLVHRNLGRYRNLGRDLMLVRRFMAANGASAKMLLEHLALSRRETE